MRGVMANLLQQKNLGPNVVYFVLGTLLMAARLTFLDKDIAYCCGMCVCKKLQMDLEADQAFVT